MAKAPEKGGKGKDEHVKKIKIVKEALPELKPGMTVKVHQKITEMGSKGEKERIQVFEGMIIKYRGGLQAGATITVRKTSDGIGVEKIFPLSAPTVVKIELVKQAAVRKAKLYFLRKSKKRLKETRFAA